MTGDSGDESNYGSIALVTTCLKVLQICLLEMFENICKLMIVISGLKKLYSYCQKCHRIYKAK